MTYELPTVLLAEDSPDDEALALRALRSAGLPLLVRVARDGQAALHALRLEAPRSRKIPDLILSDLKMPKLNGDEVLRLARQNERLAQVPFIVFSSSDLAADRERCRALGASEFVTKPVPYEEYIECVRGIVHRWLGDWHSRVLALTSEDAPFETARMGA